MRYLPTLKAKGKEVNQSLHGDPDPNPLKGNRFYAVVTKEATNLE